MRLVVRPNRMLAIRSAPATVALEASSPIRFFSQQSIFLATWILLIPHPAEGINQDSAYELSGIEVQASRYLATPGRDPRASKKARSIAMRCSAREIPAASYSPVPPSGTVPSALRGLTAVFGMGTGVTPSLWRPENLPSRRELPGGLNFPNQLNL